MDSTKSYLWTDDATAAKTDKTAGAICECTDCGSDATTPAPVAECSSPWSSFAEGCFLFEDTVSKASSIQKSDLFLIF